MPIFLLADRLANAVEKAVDVLFVFVFERGQRDPEIVLKLEGERWIDCSVLISPEEMIWTLSTFSTQLDWNENDRARHRLRFTSISWLFDPIENTDAQI